MKKIFLLSVWVLTTLNISAQTATTDPGVVINGVRWATRNVDNPGTFAPTPESAGKFYQWNRNVAWNTTDKEVTGWNGERAAGSTWLKVNDPSPSGWRIPTFHQINCLFDERKVDSEWTEYRGVRGYLFTDKTSGNSLFFPHSGFRNPHDGTLVSNGITYLWSNDGVAVSLPKGMDINSFCAYGRCVRPVAK